MELKEQILGLFFKNPEKEHYVREIARNLKKSPTTISKYLKELEKDNFLVSELKFNHLIFRANMEKSFRKKRVQYNTEKIIKSGLIDYLAEEFNEPNVIILFGSFAKGENIDKSDIDLFIQSPLKKQLRLDAFEKKLKQEVQLFIHNKQELGKLRRDNPELFNSIINGEILYGNLEL